MNIRYQAYNELTFEAYCKTSIDHAILKGRMEQAKRTALEVPLSDLKTRGRFFCLGKS